MQLVSQSLAKALGWGLPKFAEFDISQYFELEIEFADFALGIDDSGTLVVVAVSLNVHVDKMTIGPLSLQSATVRISLQPGCQLRVFCAALCIMDLMRSLSLDGAVMCNCLCNAAWWLTEARTACVGQITLTDQLVGDGAGQAGVDISALVAATPATVAVELSYNSAPSTPPTPLTPPAVTPMPSGSAIPAM